MENTTNGLSRRDFLASIGVGASALGLGLLSSACTSSKKAISLSNGNNQDLFPVYDGKQYAKKDFNYLTKNDKLGLSATMIDNHLGLYSKYVDKVNQAETMMSKNEINEFSLKELAFSLNGMALHDIYFSNMSTEASKKSAALNKAIEGTYGSFDNYYQNIIDIAMKVKGWSITGLNLLNGKIFNYGEDTHSSNFPNYVMPIMVLDVYDHAYTIDFGESDDGKAKYIEVFSKIINWDLVSRRYDAMTGVFS